MNRPKTALLLACALSTMVSAVAAREVERLSAGDSGACPADLVAAKAEAQEKDNDAVARAAKAPQSPVRAKPTVRGGDTSPTGSRLQAPRWHSFLPGMFR